MKLHEITQDYLDKINLDAVTNGWNFCTYDKNTGMISFKRDGNERINIYLTTMSVATAINHPKTGKNQLYRRNISYNELLKLFKNPRTHTGRGYRNL